MNGQPDVEVDFALNVQREAFKGELNAMKADFDTWRAQVVSSSVEIPVRIRDDATMQFRGLMATLQAEASMGIVIPVNMGGAPGLPMTSGFNPYSAIAAGALPAPLIQPMIGMGGGAVASAESAYPGTFGMSSATLSGNISEVADAMTAKQQMAEMAMVAQSEAAAAGGAAGYAAGGRSMMGGLRLMAGVMIAARGVGAAVTSYDMALGDRDPEIPQGSIAALREENRRIREYRGGFGGLVGKGRDLLHWAGRQFEPMAGGDDGFDDTTRTRANEADIVAQQKQAKGIQAQLKLLAMGQSATDFMNIGNDAYASATAPEGLDKSIAEIKKQADRLADQYRKRADELDKVAADHSLPVAKQKEAAALASQLRFDAATVPGGIADAEIARGTREYDTQRDRTLSMRGAALDALGLGNDSLRALMSGDLLGARLSEIDSQKRLSITGAQNAYNASQLTEFPMRMSDLQQQLANYSERAGLQGQAAARGEMDRYQQYINNTWMNNIDNPREHDRMSIQLSLNQALRDDPAHADIHNAAAASAMARVQRQEERELQQYVDVVHLDQMQSDNALPGGEWLGPQTQRNRLRMNGGAGSPGRAAALALQLHAQDEIGQHLGNTTADAQFRDAIKKHTAEQARRQLDTENDPEARKRLEGLIRGNYGARPGAQGEHDQLAQKAQSDASDMEAAVRNGMTAALGSLKGLYVVK